MINHARTLLLNEEGSHIPTATPGDEYIPEYDPIVLSEPLQTVYNILYGSDPDEAGKLYRTAQYMSILHSTEYSAYLDVLDSRITYDPQRSGVMSDGAYGALVLDYSDQALTLTNTWDSASALGRSVTRWRLTALSTTQVQATNETDGLQSVQTVGAGSTLVLPGSDLVFSIAGETLVAGDYWEVLHKIRPQPDLSTITQKLTNPTDAVTEAVYGTLLGDAPEPYATFYNLTQQHYALPYQLSGFLLAYIYRLESLRS